MSSNKVMLYGYTITCMEVYDSSTRGGGNCLRFRGWLGFLVTSFYILKPMK